jgi:DNA-binding Lrp family transcriptional regulator
MLDDGLLSRFGPLYNAEKMGGALTLCALSVPEDDFDAVTAKVNDFDQVAHNYRRDHRLNMWFVLATEFADEVETTIERIERATRLRVYNFPKLSEYYVGLRLDV